MRNEARCLRNSTHIAARTFQIRGQLLTSPPSTPDVSPGDDRPRSWRIIFDDDKNAIGVDVSTQSTPYTLTANREVILSSGAFGSPQLLMVTSIGAATALQELNIPVVADRPGVGRNMDDHIYFGASYPINAPTYSSLNDVAFAAEAARQYNEEQGGMFTDPTTDGIGWEKVLARLRAGMSNTPLAALAGARVSVRRRLPGAAAEPGHG